MLLHVSSGGSELYAAQGGSNRPRHEAAAVGQAGAGGHGGLGMRWRVSGSCLRAQVHTICGVYAV